MDVYAFGGLYNSKHPLRTVLVVKTNKPFDTNFEKVVACGSITLQSKTE